LRWIKSNGPAGLMMAWEVPMISIEDCVALCGLDRDAVAAIAEHEHIPEIAASALGKYMLSSPKGAEAVKQMIVDDVRRAVASGRVRHAAELIMALRHFLADYPQAGRAA
jgi:hypothetical protein